MSKTTKKKLPPINLHESSSSESDQNSFVSDSSDPESFLDLNLEEGIPEVGSYVLVEFQKKQSIFYAAKILEKKSKDEFKVSFLRHSVKKKNYFFFPIVEDVAFVDSNDIRCVLPPKIKPSETKRQQSYVG